MHHCEHRHFNYAMIDGKEYAICQECLWICNGPVARLAEG